MCYPKAFDRYSLKVLKENVGDLIPVGHDEVYQCACNLVAVGKKAVIAGPCRNLARALRRRGFAVYPLGFSEFIKEGGAAKCLTLRLT